MSNKENNTESHEPRNDLQAEEQSHHSKNNTKDSAQSNDADQVAADSAFDDSSSETPSSSPPNKPKSKGTSGAKPIKWFIVVVVLAAIAYAVYFGWEKWQDYQDNMNKADRIDQIEQQLSQQNTNIQSKLSSQNQKLDNLASELQDNQRYITQLQDQLRTTQRKFQALSSEKQQDWLFNEAEYLIREASYKLHFTDDAASIIALLQAADAQLSELNDGTLTNLRQAISQDISAVRGSGNLDIEGIAIAIETLKNNLNQLELASVQLQSDSAQPSESTDEADISSWQHFKNSVSDAASKYYTVHQFDESTQPFISPKKDRLLRENILLNLQTAQLAALQNNQSLYESNLINVKQWVEQYFKQKPATTQAYLQQLNELVDRSVELDLPTSLQSYQVISEISQQKVNRWLESDNSATESDSSTSDTSISDSPTESAGSTQPDSNDEEEPSE